MRIFPVMCAAANLNIGTDLILDLIVDDMPNPTERGEITAFVNGTEAHRPIAESASPPPTFSKPPPTRSLTHQLLPRRYRHRQERLQTRRTSIRVPPNARRTSSPHGKVLQPIIELHAGDIGAVAKLKDTSPATPSPKRVYHYPPAKLLEPPSPSPLKPSRNDEDRWQRVHRILKKISRRVSTATRRPASSFLPVAPAARGNRRQPFEKALRRGCHPEGAEDPVSGDHSRPGRRPGTPQEADRRSRPVRRLLDQDGAAPAWQQLPVRQ